MPLIRFLQLLFIIACTLPATSSGGVIINEIMASNATTIADEDGDFEDWIELKNNSLSPIDISGWGLSDSPGNPFKWSLPVGTTISAGETLLVWASGKDRSIPSSPLHTNFSISSSGESISLTPTDASPPDITAPVLLRRDLSYGRRLSDPALFGFFDEPTPAAGNSPTAYEGILPPPLISTAGGFFASPVTISLTPPPDSTICYTLDGSEPSPQRLSGESYNYKENYPRLPANPFGPLLTRQMTSHTYSEPLTINDGTTGPNALAHINTWFETSPRIPSSNTNKGTTLRARAFREGYIPSEIITHSYFVHPDIFSRHTLPVVSITTEDTNFFDYERGIYVPGKIADNWRTANPSSTAQRFQVPGNQTQRGSAWERPVHLEIFKPDGSLVMSQNLGARIHGAASRDIYLKTLRLYARSKYDDRETIDTQIFDNLEKQGSPGMLMDKFSTLLLRNSGNDARGLLFRDALIQGLIDYLPLETQAYQPALHYVNGESWGIVNLRERIDEDYFSNHFDIPNSEVVVLSVTGAVESGLPSDSSHFWNMKNYISSQDMSSPAAYDQVKQWMDVENFALYHAFQIYIDNGDWPYNNLKLWRKRMTTYDPNAPVGRDGRWRWAVYDTDFGFNNSASNTLSRVTSGPGDWSTVMLIRLLNNPDFKNLFINRLADLRNMAFAPNRVNAMADLFMQRLDPARDEHFKRWQENGPSYNASRVLTQQFKDFGASRPAIIEQQIISRFALPGAAQLTVATSGGGKISVNGNIISAETPGIPDPQQPYPWTGQYFQGVPVTIEAVAESGYRFTGWQELPAETSHVITPTLSQASTYTALFEAKPTPAVVHLWDFESASTSDPSLTSGGGLISSIPAPSTTLEISPTAKGFTSSHLRINNPLDSFIIIKLPSLGFENLELSFETRRSDEAPSLQNIDYTLDGSTWVPFDTIATQDAAPQTHRFEFSSIPGADNNTNFAIRVGFTRSQVQIDEGMGFAGNTRFDHLLLQGEILPEANLSPVVGIPIGRRETTAGTGTLDIDLGDYIFDPNPSDVLTYSATFDPPASATAAVSSETLAISGVKPGNVKVTLVATDPAGASVTTYFEILVYPSPHPLASADFLFREWSDQETAGSFPPHMIFLQGSGNNDSSLSTPFPDAYHIPSEDASFPADTDKPYAASSRTRINGLGADGVSFINSGRGRDLGSTIVSLDTRNISTASVSWVAGTILPNSRSYALRLQARNGTQAAFEDVAINDLPIEYLTNANPGHKQIIGPIELPSELIGLENLQLQWRYYLLSGSSGSRAQLSLDDIIVTTDAGPRDYESWRLTEFLQFDDRANDAVSGPASISRGISNLLRYALGLRLTDPIQPRLPRIDFSGDSPHFSFPFDPSKSDLQYTIQGSTDLTNWNQTFFDSRSTDWQPLFSNGWITLPPPTEPTPNQLFYRLHVEMNSVNLH